MIKIIVGVVLLVNAFFMYCCMVVGKRADEDLERMFRQSGIESDDKEEADSE